MLTRRDWLLGAGAAALTSAWSAEASASTLKGLSLSQLSQRADRVIVGRAVSYESRWANVAGTARIVTVSRIVQDTDFLLTQSPDEPVEDEFHILTLGGRVGSIGQKVPGEAALQVGQDLVLFVSAEEKSANKQAVRRVLGMSQGSYPLEGAATERRLRKSRALPQLVGTRPGASAPIHERFAVDALDGKALREAHALVRGAR